METPTQREQRIRRLEDARAARRQASPPLSPEGAVELAPGRGDLRVSSGSPYMPTFPMGLALLGNKVASYTELFMTQPWVAAAVMRMLSWSVRVPLKVYRRTGEKNARQRLYASDHPLADAVVNPWERGYMASLVQSLLGPTMVHGNAVCEVDEGARGKIRFGPKDWRFTRPLMPFRDSIEGFEFDVDNPRLKRAVSVDQVIHIAWWSPCGPIGVSPLQQLGITLNIEDAAQRYQKSLFLNGARPPSAIQADKEFLGLEREERQAIMETLRQDVTELYSGPDNGGKPALLPPGLEWKPVGHSAVEAALIDQRKITREEIAGVYMIPPPMLGILDKATYSNIETQREMTYTDCLGPPLILIEQIINAQVVKGLLAEDDIFVEFDFAGVLRGNKLEEIEALREQINSALLTPNEGRDVINMPRSSEPAMDLHYLPFNNLAPVGTDPQPIQPPAERQPTKRQKRRETEHLIRVVSRGGTYDYDPMEVA